MENKIDYTKNGDYYLPNLVYETDEASYGRYGMLRKKYLEEHTRIRYNLLLLTGKLTQDLNRIDKRANEMLETIMTRLEKKDPAPPQGTMEWVQWKNKNKSIAEEFIMRDIVYNLHG